MKKILFLLLILIPALSFSQSYEKRNALVNRYENLGYSIYKEYNFTVEEGNEKYIDRTFYDGTDYVILFIPLQSGVYDADLFIDYSDGENFFKDEEEDVWAGIEFTPAYTQEMRVYGKNYSSWSDTYNYDFTLVIMGRDSR